MNSFDLYNTLKRVPFLKIGNVDYLNDLKSALDQLRTKELVPFTSGSNKMATEIRLGLDVLSIYDFTPESKMGGTSTTINNNFKQDLWKECVPTDIVSEFPVLGKAVTDYLDVPSRCRFSKLPAGKHVLWHSHSYLHTAPSITEIILHLPIQAVNVKAQIKDSKRQTLYEEEFKEGEVWYLNTWLPHSFANNGSLDRYHIWYNAYLTNGEKQSINLKLHKLLEDALLTYKGPYVE
jgi:hypothetical protein